MNNFHAISRFPHRPLRDHRRIIIHGLSVAWRPPRPTVKGVLSVEGYVRPLNFAFIGVCTDTGRSWRLTLLFFRPGTSWNLNSCLENLPHDLYVMQSLVSCSDVPVCSFVTSTLGDD